MKCSCCGVCLSSRYSSYEFGKTLILPGPVSKAYVDSSTLEIQVKSKLERTRHILAG
jgi:hypothetical protein